MAPLVDWWFSEALYQLVSSCWAPSFDQGWSHGRTEMVCLWDWAGFDRITYTWNNINIQTCTNIYKHIQTAYKLHTNCGFWCGWKQRMHDPSTKVWSVWSEPVFCWASQLFQWCTVMTFTSKSWPQQPNNHQHADNWPYTLFFDVLWRHHSLVN